MFPPYLVSNKIISLYSLGMVHLAFECLARIAYHTKYKVWNEGTNKCYRVHGNENLLSFLVNFVNSFRYIFFRFVQFPLNMRVLTIRIFSAKN